jgi:hypothetical protein
MAGQPQSARGVPRPPPPPDGRFVSGYRIVPGAQEETLRSAPSGAARFLVMSNVFV